MKATLHAFGAGALFAVGLGLAGMTQPDKVISFLHVTGNWDPSLMFVMGAAAAVYGVAYRLSTKREAPALGGRFLIPTRQDINLRLVGGAAVFGLGWGLAGYCPGPALTSVTGGGLVPLIFVAAMAGGMQLVHVADALRDEWAVGEAVSD